MMDIWNTFFKKIQISSLILTLLGSLFGLAALLRPNTVSLGLCRVMGAGILIGAVSCLISYFTSPFSRFWKGLALTGAILLGIIALWILFRPTSVLRLLSLMLGVMLIANGATDFQLGMLLFGGPLRRFSAVFAVVSILLGIAAVLNPLSASALIMRLIGLLLLIGSIFGLYLILRFYKNQKNDRSQDSSPLS